MAANSNVALEPEIREIVLNEFDQAPRKISRRTNGICNEVYLVVLDDRDVVVRLNSEKRFLLGSHNHIPLFKSKDIIVPDILAEDYSKTLVPYAYQVLSKIDGQDIGDVIDTLTDQQLKAVAREISTIFRKLRDVPTNGKFGVLWGDERELVGSWTEHIGYMVSVLEGRGNKTGLMDDGLQAALRWIDDRYTPYFDSVQSVCYFGDLSSKNVMISNGVFSGLVDLDSLAQGDYLEAVGRIKASWWGTRHGSVYTQTIMDEEGLGPEQRKTVTMYALLNRIYWTCENGIAFNNNTSTQVDWAKAREDKETVKSLWRELASAT